MLYKRFVFYLILSVCLILGACSDEPPPFECTDPLGCVTLKPEDSFKIGVIQDLSGGGAIFGKDQIRGLELAIAERNGKLLDHPLDLHIEDEGCSQEGGANAALRIVADPEVVAIFGTTCSSAAGSAAKIMSESKLSMISGVNSSTSLTSLNGEASKYWYSGYFRTMLNVGLEGEAAASFVFNELGLHKAAVIDDGDAFSESYKDRFAKAFSTLGGNVVLDITVNKGATELEPVIHSVALSEADVIFLSLFPPEGAAFVKQVRQLEKLDGVTIFAGGALRTEDFIAEAGEAAKGVYSIGSAPPARGEASERVLAAYEKNYGEEPPTVTYAYGFDAANLLFNAIEKSAVTEKDGTVHIGRQALRTALYNTQDLLGLTGMLSCDDFGDCASIKFDLVRLEDPEAGVEGFLSNVIHTYEPE